MYRDKQSSYLPDAHTRCAIWRIVSRLPWISYRLVSSISERVQAWQGKS